MRSSSGAHYVALDHVRAVAAFMVFAWHFTHGADGSPVPFAGAPAVFPLALLDEGHTGVALFMTLSGYLFARLLDGARVRWGAFVLNRALRLLPLLGVVIALVALQKAWRGEPLGSYWAEVGYGLWRPSLPNGAWSVTVELHFYLLLPLLLALQRRSAAWLAAVLALAIALRTGLWLQRGEVQIPAYWTLAGRIDQFVLGMLAFTLRGTVLRRRAAVGLMLLAFLAFYAWFAADGGFYGRPSYPSPGALWIVLPTLEGLAYALVIAWYDGALRTGPGQPGDAAWSRVLARYGDWSYAIYLLHVFVVFDAARWVHRHVMDLSNFYVACAWALAGFALMAIPAELSGRLIERPFLRLRRPYAERVRSDDVQHDGSTVRRPLAGG